MTNDQQPQRSGFVGLSIRGIIAIVAILILGVLFFRNCSGSDSDSRRTTRRVPAVKPAVKVECPDVQHAAEIRTAGCWRMHMFAGQRTKVVGASRIAILPGAGVSLRIQYYRTHDASGTPFATQPLDGNDGVNTRYRFPKGTQSVAFTSENTGTVTVRYNQPCNPRLEKC